MPTILNNACINRVQKVLKLKLTSNDLNALKTTPFNVLPLKQGNSFVGLKAVDILFPEGHGYSGNLQLNCLDQNLLVCYSYNNLNGLQNPVLDIFPSDSGFYELSASPDFSIGVVRPDIELHFYYTIESVNVDFDAGYIPSD